MDNSKVKIGVFINTSFINNEILKFIYEKLDNKHDIVFSNIIVNKNNLRYYKDFLAEKNIEILDIDNDIGNTIAILDIIEKRHKEVDDFWFVSFKRDVNYIVKYLKSRFNNKLIGYGNEKLINSFDEFHDYGDDEIINEMLEKYKDNVKNSRIKKHHNKLRRLYANLNINTLRSHLRKVILRYIGESDHISYENLLDVVKPYNIDYSKYEYSDLWELLENTKYIKTFVKDGVKYVSVKNINNKEDIEKIYDQILDKIKKIDSSKYNGWISLSIVGKNIGKLLSYNKINSSILFVVKQLKDIEIKHQNDQYLIRIIDK